MTKSLAAVAVVALVFTAQGAAAERGNAVSTPKVAGVPSSGALAGLDQGRSVRCLLPPGLTRMQGNSVALAPSRVAEIDITACLQRGGRHLGPAT